MKNVFVFSVYFMAFKNSVIHMLYHNVIKALMHFYNLQSQQNTIIHFLEYSFTVIRLIWKAQHLVYVLSIIVTIKTSGVDDPQSTGSIDIMGSPHFVRKLPSISVSENDHLLLILPCRGIVCASSTFGFWLPLWHLQTFLATHTGNEIGYNFIIS